MAVTKDLTRNEITKRTKPTFLLLKSIMQNSCTYIILTKTYKFPNFTYSAYKDLQAHRVISYSFIIK